MEERIIFRAYQDHNIIYQKDNTIDSYKDFFNRLQDNAILMQSIGIPDCNGTMIFEKDIISYTSLESGVIIQSCVSIINGTPTIGKSWSDGIFDWYSMEQYHPIDLKIVGEIYSKSK